MISFANIKGGVGKTTTCIQVGKTFASLGLRTLIIDADKQANATRSLIGPTGEHCLLHVIKGSISIQDAILNVDENLDLLPSNLMNARLDSETNNPALNITKYIKTFLKDLNYEYILIDTGPSLSRINSFIIGSSDLVVAPVLLDECSITRLRLISDTVNSINQNFDANVTMRSLVNRYDNRMTSSLNILSDLKETGVRPFVSTIQASTDYVKVQASGDIPVSSNTKRDFFKFAAELLEINPEKNASHNSKSLLEKINKYEAEIEALKLISLKGARPTKNQEKILVAIRNEIINQNTNHPVITRSMFIKTYKVSSRLLDSSLKDLLSKEVIGRKQVVYAGSLATFTYELRPHL